MFENLDLKRRIRVRFEKFRPLRKLRQRDELVAYMQLIRDDFCLYEVCRRLVDEGVTRLFWAEPDRYWSGEPVEPEYSSELDSVASRLEADGITVLRRKFGLSNYQSPGMSRTLVETRVRNASLKWVRKQGSRHVLIVDGDELWLRGTLNIVRAAAERGVAALALRMIPAIGLPALPIEGATDLAVVYIGPGRTFCDCRMPWNVAVIPDARIIHFTGVRRTMAETIQKHKRSAHFGDPDYRYEEWLQRVLPNVQVGLKNAHMYRPQQIWPEVRAWKRFELDEIPQSLHRYLAVDQAESESITTANGS